MGNVNKIVLRALVGKGGEKSAYGKETVSTSMRSMRSM